MQKKIKLYSESLTVRDLSIPNDCSNWKLIDVKSELPNHIAHNMEAYGSEKSWKKHISTTSATVGRNILANVKFNVRMRGQAYRAQNITTPSPLIDDDRMDAEENVVVLEVEVEEAKKDKIVLVEAEVIVPESYIGFGSRGGGSQGRSSAGAGDGSKGGGSVGGEGNQGGMGRMVTVNAASSQSCIA
ncbi:unnamed protein product [Sphenostylis stenocarpa]|uniref:Uncharacterized protein n=1 Tax=Sphenostylis stenocarpa TaxID=92480 RepID=A0AA86RR32_9FABA|nr:unnamed protein product [Sphenostylis stenocarpa]